MNCQTCDSTRVLSTHAHASDRQNYSLREASIDAYYAPRIPGICGGDALFPDICLDCGQCQGTFPKEQVPKLEDEVEDQ
jgi:hypothetical protein